MSETPRDPEASLGEGAQKDPVELLVKALAALPAPDRDLVYAWLLRREPLPGVGSAREPSPGVGRAEAALRAAWHPGPVPLTTAFLQPPVPPSVRATVASGQQMVPVRFSSEQHAQLREWCAEHGFSMATVIRGLVARFLEGQLPGSAQRA